MPANTHLRACASWLLFLQLHGRTDNTVKNFMNSHKKKLQRQALKSAYAARLEAREKSSRSGESRFTPSSMVHQFVAGSTINGPPLVKDAPTRPRRDCLSTPFLPEDRSIPSSFDVGQVLPHLPSTGLPSPGIASVTSSNISPTLDCGSLCYSFAALSLPFLQSQSQRVGIPPPISNPPAWPPVARWTSLPTHEKYFETCISQPWQSTPLPADCYDSDYENAQAQQWQSAAENDSYLLDAVVGQKTQVSSSVKTSTLDSGQRELFALSPGQPSLPDDNVDVASASGVVDSVGSLFLDDTWYNMPKMVHKNQRME